MPTSTQTEELVRKFEEHEKNKTWANVFKDLQESSQKQEEELGLTCDEAFDDKNQAKNRYCNVIPYDQHLVRLKSENYYINASLLNIPLTGQSYIFTQGPLENTTDDFWQMVWEQNSQIIVMLCTFTEREIPKCYSYFPHADKDAEEYRDITVTLVKEENTNKNFVIRHYTLNHKNHPESRLIRHFHYVTWPDFGVPEKVNDFLQFVEVVREYESELKESGPVVCHCSAGIGRTGTFTVVDVIVTALLQKTTKNLPLIDDLILSMRRNRMQLVQTPAQLRFCWKAVVEFIRKEEAVKEEAKDVVPSTNEFSEKVGDFQKAATLPRKRRSDTRSPESIQKRKSEDP